MRISRGDNYSHTTISSCRSAFYTISPDGIEPHRCVCLKKWPGRLVTLQHLKCFKLTLIYFSYYRIKNKLTSQRNRTFSEQSRPLLYHALRTSTCQILIAWLESNQRPVLIHTFTVSFTIIVSTDLPLNYTQSKMVGAVGLAPTKAFRPGDLQSPAIATMRYSQKNGSRGGFRTPNPAVNSRMLYH